MTALGGRIVRYTQHHFFLIATLPANPDYL